MMIQRLLLCCTLLFSFAVPATGFSQTTKRSQGKIKRAKKTKPKKKRRASTQSASNTCDENSAFFAGRCRSRTWMLETLFGAVNIEGPIVTADRVKGNRNPVQIVSGNQIVEVGARKVNVSSKKNRKRTRSKRGRSGRRGSMQAQAAVVPNEFHRGGYLIQRRLTVDRAQDNTRWTVRVEKPRRSATGQYRWNEIQRLEFNPRRQTPVCIPGQPCVNAEFACEAAVVAVTASTMGAGKAFAALAVAGASTGGIAWAVVAVVGATASGYNAYQCAKENTKKMKK